MPTRPGYPTTAAAMTCGIADAAGFLGTGRVVERNGRLWVLTCEHVLPSAAAARSATCFVGDYDIKTS